MRHAAITRAPFRSLPPVQSRMMDPALTTADGRASSEASSATRGLSGAKAAADAKVHDTAADAKRWMPAVHLGNSIRLNGSLAGVEEGQIYYVYFQQNDRVIPFKEGQMHRPEALRKWEAIESGTAIEV